MTQGIYAVNAHYFTEHREPVMLVNYANLKMVEEFFTVVAKSTEEWYIMLEDDAVQDYLEMDSNAEEYDKELYNLAVEIDRRSKEIGERYNMEPSNLLWVW